MKKKFTLLCLALLSVVSFSCQQKMSGDEKALEELNNEYMAQKKQNETDSTLYNFVDRYEELCKRFEETGNLQKAIECDKAVLKIYTQIWDEPIVRIALRQWAIGEKYKHLNDNDSTEKYMYQAIETAKNLETNETYTEAMNNRFIAGCYQVLALIYSDPDKMEKHKIAIESLETAIKLEPMENDGDKQSVAAYSDLLGALYGVQGKHSSAAKYFEKAVNIYKEICPDSITRINELEESLLLARYRSATEEGIKIDSLANYIFVINCVDGDTPARKQGMTGEYILLELADWNLNSETSLFLKSDETENHPIDIVIMKNDVVEKHHFKDKIGIEYQLRKFSKEEIEHINAVYKKWKSNPPA